jgi:isopentenyl-diphosphate Delta-isomerase
MDDVTGSTPGSATAEVVLVDREGRVLGSCGKLAAHEAPGQLHRAFSVFVYREDGQLLLQQRAASKYHFPLRWANACCSHPRPGEALLVAAARRCREELGVELEFERAGRFEYRAEDASSGLVEHELDEVLVTTLATGASLAPDPAEVARLCFVDPLALRQGRALLDGAQPFDLAPWVLEALAIAEAFRGDQR